MLTVLFQRLCDTLYTLSASLKPNLKNTYLSSFLFLELHSCTFSFSFSVKYNVFPAPEANIPLHFWSPSPAPRAPLPYPLPHATQPTKTRGHCFNAWHASPIVPGCAHGVLGHSASALYAHPSHHCTATLPYTHALLTRTQRQNNVRLSVRGHVGLLHSAFHKHHYE